MSIEKLVLMSNKYGMDSSYVLAGGGNTSYKDDKLIYVKGSGTSLASITKEGFVIMERDGLSRMWSREYPESDKEKEAEVLSDMMNARVKGEEHKRPSVETLLHDLFPQKYVLHVHPALVNGITCSVESETTVKRLFRDTAVYVPSVKPGYTLAVYCKEAMDKYKSETGKTADLVILQNHGIFFAADTTEEIDTLVENTMTTIKANINRHEDFSECTADYQKILDFSPKLRMIYMKLTESDTALVKHTVNKEIQSLCENEQSFTPLLKAFTPDHIVYYKAKPLYLKNCDDIKSELDKFIAENKYVPKVIAVEKLGCFICGNTKKEADTAVSLFLDAVKIAVYTESFGGYNHLSDELTDFIVNWEFESYRQKVALSGGSVKRLNEKIAVITGAAQGFGKGLAEMMRAEGANVIIADMNYDGAAEVADKLGMGCMALKVNVTDEMSVSEMTEKTVAEFGGIDIFINNAGIVRAGGLDELTLKDFELVTSVNYTAYFLCVKYTCKIMKIQTDENSDYMCDIIEINSKSGLAGSNKNFAYAGSKFGGIGLTQSFAMELAPHKIKVNAICPGNFLDGPLWSNPVSGLFVQYLNSGKVPGAKTVNDVRKFYESKVPLNRGCEIADVMRAVLYAVEQKYETGQAIPVTGGQEMIK